MMIPAYNKKRCAAFLSRRESITGAKVRLLFPKKTLQSYLTRDSNPNLLAVALSTIQVTVRFGSVPEGEHSGSAQRPPTYLTRRLAARRLFRVPPCREGTIHLQTSMSSPRFEPSPNGTTVSVASHYTGWATKSRMQNHVGFTMLN
ncbi:hypothetical protein TNCV_1268361 [Trichonephila clavipes]|nr:hypothetical protein TNCV_1268361 [Trichonephila clavipes]